MATTRDDGGREPADGGREPRVDMSPKAIERRLAAVGALYRLMRSLMTAKPVSER
jgi:hypothetical protein